MKITKEISELIDSIANQANSIRRKAFFYLAFGITSAFFIGWHWVNMDQQTVWIVVKVIILALPILIWFLFCHVTKQLIELPQAFEMLEEAGQEGIALIQGLSHSSNTKNQSKAGMSKIFQLVKMLRNPEIFEFVIDSVKGIAILMNPLLLFALLASSVVIFLYALIALFLLIF